MCFLFWLLHRYCCCMFCVICKEDSGLRDSHTVWWPRCVTAVMWGGMELLCASLYCRCCVPFFLPLLVLGILQLLMWSVLIVYLCTPVPTMQVILHVGLQHLHIHAHAQYMHACLLTFVMLLWPHSKVLPSLPLNKMCVWERERERERNGGGGGRRFNGNVLACMRVCACV